MLHKTQAVRTVRYGSCWLKAHRYVRLMHFVWTLKLQEMLSNISDDHKSVPLPSPSMFYKCSRREQFFQCGS